MSTATITRRPHPARYSVELLPLAADALRTCCRVLDPMAGTGERLAELRDRHLPNVHFVGVELEDWHGTDRSIVVRGDATALPFPSGTFDGIVVSPAYGNRMADAYDGRDGSTRHTYRTALGRPLHDRNGAGLQWGAGYRDLHVAAWTEARRVLAPGGVFVLSIADHVRAGVRQHVTDWHVCTLLGLGFSLRSFLEVPTPKMRHGANAALRCPEVLVVFRLEAVGQ